MVPEDEARPESPRPPDVPAPPLAGGPQEPPPGQAKAPAPRSLREWRDAELLGALDARETLPPGQGLRLEMEARRRGIAPASSLALLRRGLADLLVHPGRSVLVGLLSGGALFGWPFLVLVIAEAMFRGMRVGTLLLLAAGWGAGALLAAVLPFLMSLTLPAARGKLRGPEGASAVLTSLAGLGVALTLAVPALITSLVPCVGGWFVLSAWAALLVGAAAPVGLALSGGLDPLGALEAFREGERRRGRSLRLRLGLGLGAVPYGMMFLVLVSVVFRSNHGPGPEAMLIVTGIMALGLLWSATLGVWSAAAYCEDLRGCLSRAAAAPPPLPEPEPGKPEPPGAAEERAALPRTFYPPPGGGQGLVLLAGLFLLVPVGTPFWAPAMAELIQDAMLPVAAWAAVPTGHLGGLAGGLLLLHLHRQRRRAVSVDRAGVLLDVGPRWPGTRIPWVRVRGYLLEDDGVRLVLEGRRLSRWLGPLVPARERGAHELLLVLDRRRIPRLG